MALRKKHSDTHGSQAQWIDVSSSCIRICSCWTVAFLASVIVVSFLARLQSKVIARSGERYRNGRFGIGVTNTGGPPSQYDVGLLNAGWYWDWAARVTPTLESLAYVQTIRLSPQGVSYTATPTGAALLEIVAAHPGEMWFISNEPDCVWQDDVRSDIYAQAYHDLYTAIKEADPTASIGAGSIVQPTPQRLRYLDRVLATYEQTYGEPLPADFWVTHNYILCENCFPQRQGDPFAWGACPVPDWPDGTEDAVYHSVYDHWRLDIFQKRIIAFRRWMRDHGYRERPLFVSEYGILFYDGLVAGRTVEDNIAFMKGSFDWMREAQNPNLGYPPDDNRLVQRWAWFSLDHDSWYMGGALFDYVTHEPLEMGSAYGEYTAALTPTIELVIRLRSKPVHGPVGRPITATLQAYVSNAGNVGTDEPVTMTFFAGESGAPVLDEISLPPLACCGDGRWVSIAWPNLVDGGHSFCVRAATSVNEITACGVVLVNPLTAYLPLVTRAAGGLEAYNTDAGIKASEIDRLLMKCDIESLSNG